MLKVQPASTKDVDKLLECFIDIWKSLSEYLPNSAVNPELEELLKPEAGERLRQQIEDKSAIFLAAYEDEEVVGVAYGRFHAGVVLLGFLGVKKEHRGKKVGESLLDRFIEEAISRGAQKVWLYTSPRLLPAIRLYIKKGFVPEGFLRKHFHSLDLIIYSKFLSEEV